MSLEFPTQPGYGISTTKMPIGIFICTASSVIRINIPKVLYKGWGKRSNARVLLLVELMLHNYSRKVDRCDK